MRRVVVHPARRPCRRRGLAAALAAIGAAAAVLAALPWRFVAIPDEAEVVNPGPSGEPARRGRAAFYGEVFVDASAALSGPLRPWPVLRALLALRGAGTRSLRVELAEDATIGGRSFARGSTIETGLDVAAGSWVPLGVTVEVSRLSLRVGFTCALCHATVDPETRRVVHGAANRDLRIGLILALGRDPALRGHVEVAGDGGDEALERALVAWPPGTFDAGGDGVAGPVRIPELFGPALRVARAGHPFGEVADAEEKVGWLAGVAPPTVAVDGDAAALGRQVFARAGCEGCHADGAGLAGLWWRAPYLRDGSLSVGTGEARVGAAVAERGAEVDPRASLRALIDRELRGRVVTADRVDAGRWQVGASGLGHAFWVDPAAGFSAAEQRALVEHLLSIEP